MKPRREASRRGHQREPRERGRRSAAINVAQRRPPKSSLRATSSGAPRRIHYSLIHGALFPESRVSLAFPCGTRCCHVKRRLENAFTTSVARFP